MFENKFRHTILLFTTTFLLVGMASSQEIQNSTCKKGIAALYPGDEGIEKHESVVMPKIPVAGKRAIGNMLKI